MSWLQCSAWCHLGVNFYIQHCPFQVYRKTEGQARAKKLVLQEVEEIIDSFDVNHSGKLEIQEFLRM